MKFGEILQEEIKNPVRSIQYEHPMLPVLRVAIIISHMWLFRNRFDHY